MVCGDIAADLWATTSGQQPRACPLNRAAERTSNTASDQTSGVSHEHGPQPLACPLNVGEHLQDGLGADVAFGMDALLGGNDVWFGDSFREVSTATMLQAPPRHVLHVDFGRRAWEDDGALWLSRFNARLQHALLRLIHHVHPLVNEDTGERRVLTSCRPKDKRNVCKGDFPLEEYLTDEPLLVCQCIADARGFAQRGPRSLLGTTLPLRNHAWLNAGPRTWIAFTADNGDLKFPHRIPILAETRDCVRLFDIRRTDCVRSSSEADMLFDFQAGLSMAAGYFGGYTSKMQDVGHRELQRMTEALARKVSVEKKSTGYEAFNLYSKRLLKDLEAKGIIRTAVESVNLSLQANHKDVLMAECIRTFPTVTFQASLLLKREEVETKKVAGSSIIAALHHSRCQKGKAYVESPFDLLYGFRGSSLEVDLLCPYEMLMHWSMEKIRPPSLQTPADAINADLTPAGRLYQRECKTGCGYLFCRCCCESRAVLGLVPPTRNTFTMN